MWEMFTGELKDNQVYGRQWDDRSRLLNWIQKMENNGSKIIVEDSGEREQ